MKESIEMKMRYAMRSFRRNMKVGADSGDAETKKWLSDNYYLLERRAQKAADECKRVEKALKGSDLFSGLFTRCAELCKNGCLPDENGITEFFGDNGLDGISAGCLSLAVVCALINCASKSIQAQNPKHLSNAVVSLRKVDEIDFELVSERLFKAEEILRKDPTGTYSSMDKQTKSFYRRRIAVTAFKSGKSETEIASKALEKAKKSEKHIGFYIVNSKKNTKRGNL